MITLPNDILREVLSFIPRSHPLCVVSQQWHDLTHLRAVTLKNEAPAKVMKNIQILPPHSIKFHMDDDARLPTQLIPFIRGMSTTITLLDLVITFRCHPPVGVQRRGPLNKIAFALTGLGSLKRLERLELVLHPGHISELGTHHLLNFSQCKRLSYLDLDLSRIAFGERGGRYLSVLANLTQLSTALLNLSVCQLGNESVKSISHLSALPLLAHLGLGLGENNLGDVAVQHLCNFSSCAALRHLSIILFNNGDITDAAVSSLSSLYGNPSLKSVYIWVPSSATPATISALMNSPRDTLQCTIE
jgi:hypothetical protein